MKILVTGGAGFIGSHLVDALIERGYDVVALDDLSAGAIANIAHLLDDRRFEFVRGDIRDEAVLRATLEKCDAVIHLAARIGMRAVVESPLETMEVNGRGTEMVLHAARAKNVPTIVASTSEVYGHSLRIPSSEADPIAFGSPTIGRWSYACAKAYDEFYALALHREHGLPAAVARLFNTVGPRQTGRYGMVIPRFVAQAQAGEPLSVYGDGTQTRCFCYVGDAVSGLIAMLERIDDVAGEVFNVGNPQEISIAELANRVIEVTESRSTIAFVPFSEAYPSGFEEIMRRVPDISKARTRLGFDPRTSLYQILSSVLMSRREKELSA